MPKTEIYYQDLSVPLPEDWRILPSNGNELEENWEFENVPCVFLSKGAQKISPSQKDLIILQAVLDWFDKASHRRFLAVLITPDSTAIDVIFSTVSKKCVIRKSFDIGAQVVLEDVGKQLDAAPAVYFTPTRENMEKLRMECIKKPLTLEQQKLDLVSMLERDYINRSCLFRWNSHSARAAAVVAAVKSATSTDAIREVLLQQQNLFAGKEYQGTETSSIIALRWASKEQKAFRFFACSSKRYQKVIDEACRLTLQK